MTIDLDRIANLAEMATKGPWRVERDDAWHGQHVMAGTIMVADVPMFGNTCSADCDLIAALSPDTVLRLVAVCRAAKAYRDEPSPDEHTGPYCELLAALDRVES